MIVNSLDSNILRFHLELWHFLQKNYRKITCTLHRKLSLKGNFNKKATSISYFHEKDLINFTLCRQVEVFKNKSSLNSR